MSSPARLRITFHLPDAAAEWAGTALTDLFPDGLLLVPQPGGVTRLRGWIKAGRLSLPAAARRRLEACGASRISAALDRPRAAALPHGRFPAQTIGRFRIVSAQEAPKAAPAGGSSIVLVQGQAFGSGRHESTRLMLRIIESAPPLGQDVLDVGAGSGILGFACLHLGARRVACVEIESAACAELRRNRALNAVPPSRMPVLCGRFPLRRLQGRSFPLVLANLVTPLLCTLMPRLAARVARGGTLLCSGIHTDAEARAVAAAGAARGLRLRQRARLRSWNALRFKRT